MIPSIQVEDAFGVSAYLSAERLGPLRLAVVLEGPNDVSHLERLSRLLSRSDPGIPDLDELARLGTIAFVTTGAASICPIPAAVCGLGPPELHLYDRESGSTICRRQRHVEAINRRPNCHAELTRRRSLENYLHPDAIDDARGLRVSYGPEDDVATLVATATLKLEPSQWLRLSARTRRRVRCRVKRWLNRDAVECMNRQRLHAHDPDGEVLGWLFTIATMLRRGDGASR